jgi:4-diphosphocytidyl-2C-methyl-D-erythritol kinase
MGIARIQSPAKVNLFLKVLGKREDGYHEIYTLIQPISLFDEIDTPLFNPSHSLTRLSSM